MSNERKTKWEIGQTISAGNNAYALTMSYRLDLEARLQPDELAQLKANTTELEVRRSGQMENLVMQKSKTLGQEEIIGKLRNTVSSLRSIVRSTSMVTTDIMKAYGVGESMHPNISSVIAGGISLYRPIRPTPGGAMAPESSRPISLRLRS